MTAARQASGQPARLRTTALLPAALLAVTVFVRIPIEVYAGSAVDFASSSLDVLIAVSTAGLLLFGLLMLIVVSLPARLARHVDGAAVGLASYAWIRSGFFAGPSVSLDGTPVEADLSTGLAGLLLPLAGAALLAWLAGRRRRVVTTLLAVLLGGALVQTTIMVVSVWRPRRSASAATLASVLEWSRRENVLVLILDTLQSDVFQDLLEAQPALREQLDGFRYFRQASSSGPTTYLSLPTIHSGRFYDPSQSAWAFYNQAINEQSVLNRLGRAGYRVSYARGTAGCPTAVADCPSALALARSRVQVAIQESTQLLEIGIYRVLPDGLRTRLLSGKQGPIRTALGRILRRERAEGDADALERLARSSVAADTPPTAKIFHSMITHPPNVLRPDCTVRERRQDRESAVQQAACAFKHVVALLERLRSERVYDVSNLIVIGDHGAQFESRFAGAGQDAKFRRMVGALNPVVLVKPAGARGPLTTSNAPIELADISEALCDDAGRAPAEGLARLDAVDPKRTRVAFWCTWRNGHWRLPRIPDLVRYSIRGDIADHTSWWQEAAVYAPGTLIDFRRGQNAARYVGFGWGRRQATHTWVVAEHAGLRLRARLEPGRDQLLLLTAPLLDPSPTVSRRVGVEVNGVEVAELPCADPARRASTISLKIPASLLSHAPETTISFRTKQREAGSEGDEFDPCFALQTLELRPAP